MGVTGKAARPVLLGGGRGGLSLSDIGLVRLVATFLICYDLEHSVFFGIVHHLLVGIRCLMHDACLAGSSQHRLATGLACVVAVD